MESDPFQNVIQFNGHIHSPVPSLLTALLHPLSYLYYYAIIIKQKNAGHKLLSPNEGDQLLNDAPCYTTREFICKICSAEPPTTASPTSASPTTKSPTTESPTTVSPTSMYVAECQGQYYNNIGHQLGKQATCGTVNNILSASQCCRACAQSTCCVSWTFEPTMQACFLYQEPFSVPGENHPGCVTGGDGSIYTTTESPTTVSPTTESPTTVSPTTESPTTVSPTTESPTTVSPTTESPTTVSPTTESPTTQSPTTQSPTSLSPTSADTCYFASCFKFVTKKKRE